MEDIEYMKVYEHIKDGRRVIVNDNSFRIYQKRFYQYDPLHSFSIPPVLTLTYKHLYGGKLGNFDFRCFEKVFKEQYKLVKKQELTPLWKVLNG